MDFRTSYCFGYHFPSVSSPHVDVYALFCTSSHDFLFQVLRTDIVMDVGKSLNPAIDIGQIEGACAQGYGLFTLEQHRISPDGFLFTRGPGMYKIPSFGDVPIEMNVTLLKGASNPKSVYESKVRRS